MAGNHFKNGDGERSAVPPRSNGTGNAGVPSGSSQNGAGNRTSPGETAMFAALYEQSQKAKQAGRVGRQAFPGGSGSAASSAGVRPAPTGGANVAGSTGPASGIVEGVIDLRGLLPDEEIAPDTDVLNGIAYDAASERIFVTGKRWSKLFEIEIIPQ